MTTLDSLRPVTEIAEGSAFRGRRRRPSAAMTAYYVVAAIIAGLFLFPLLWTCWRSLQGPLAEGSAPTWSILTQLSLRNYTGLLANGGSSLWHYALNSLIVAVCTVIGATIVAVLAGYGLARLKFRGSNAVFILLLAPFMVPFQALLTPLFTVLAALHLTDSLVGLILVYCAYQVPFSVYIMRNSFSSIPGEIEEAAIMDGASTMQILRRVQLPLVVPGVVTVVLYAFLYGWNEFLGALMLITTDSKVTLPVALSNLETGTYGQVNLGQLDAGAVVAMIPCIVVFLLLQRYYVSGLAAGAVKA